MPAISGVVSVACADVVRMIQAPTAAGGEGRAVVAPGPGEAWAPGGPGGITEGCASVSARNTSTVSTWPWRRRNRVPTNGKLRISPSGTVVRMLTGVPAYAWRTTASDAPAPVPRAVAPGGGPG